MDNDRSDVSKDALDDSYVAISEAIEQLSEATETPTDFEPSNRPFDGGEVDLRSAGWLAKLAEVQGWLRLENDLTLDDPHSSMQSLARGLGFEGDSSVLDLAGGEPQLTIAGLERLSARLQLAVRLQESFQGFHEEDGASLESATARWRGAWDDASDVEEGSGPVSARTGIWNIHDFADRAVRKKLNLSPSYQR